VTQSTASAAPHCKATANHAWILRMIPLWFAPTGGTPSG
jgi:hypothetical protein